MNLQLLSIQFRDASPGAIFAIPLRKDPVTPPFPLPEWQNSGESFVAWNLDRTKTADVRISIRFLSDASQTFEVKADDPSGNNLSGSISPFVVQTTGGVPVTVRVPLDAPLLTDPARQHVALRDDTWVWSARVVGDYYWTGLIRTTHRAYTVLAAPNLPWGVNAPELYVWTDALEFACKWAAGAKDVYSAAGQIARSFFGLGAPDANPRVTYGASLFCPGYPDVFACIDLIRYLTTGIPPYRTDVDCSVAASTVSTLTNALGGTLVQGRVGPFTTNQVVLIGGCQGHMQFVFHELAWGGSAGSQDPVWDACLMVDGDSDPTNPPFTFVTGAGTPFTSVFEIGYRERLVRPCDAIKTDAPVCRVLTDNRPLGTRIPPPRFTPGKSPGLFPVNLANFLARVNLDPWRVYEWYIDTRGVDVVKYLSTVLIRDGPEPRASVDYFRCPSSERAKEILDVLRGSFSLPTVNIDSIGDGGFALPDGTATVFVRSNLVVQTMPGSLDHGPIKDLPGIVDAALLQAFNTNVLIE